MRILKEDASSGNVKVQIETDEDLWHLYIHKARFACEKEEVCVRAPNCKMKNNG